MLKKFKVMRSKFRPAVELLIEEADELAKNFTGTDDEQMVEIFTDTESEQIAKQILTIAKQIQSETKECKTYIDAIKQDIQDLKDGQQRIETKVDNLLSELRCNRE